MVEKSTKDVPVAILLVPAPNGSGRLDLTDWAKSQGWKREHSKHADIFQRDQEDRLVVVWSARQSGAIEYGIVYAQCDAPIRSAQVAGLIGYETNLRDRLNVTLHMLGVT